MEKLLILSDIHYPLAGFTEISRIIRKVKPDCIALLGDNIEPSASSMPAVELYSEFIGRMGKVFPLEKTILMLGDNDYMLHGQKSAIFKYVNSLHTMNGNHVLYRKGNMLFSHGNIERSRHLEKVGMHLVRISHRLNVQHIVPVLVSIIARISLHARNGDYLFIGHIHLLRKVRSNRVTFCGTLNRKAKFFGKHSMGYVVVKHKNFNVGSERDITTVPIIR